jgi:hypothetical protein
MGSLLKLLIFYAQSAELSMKSYNITDLSNYSSDNMTINLYCSESSASSTSGWVLMLIVGILITMGNISAIIWSKYSTSVHKTSCYFKCCESCKHNVDT